MKNGLCRESGMDVWYLNGLIHREDGPAVIWDDGTKMWYKRSRLHREDGPAVVYDDGEKEWWIEAVNLSKEEWLKRLSDEMKIKVLFNEGSLL